MKKKWVETGINVYDRIVINQMNKIAVNREKPNENQL